MKTIYLFDVDGTLTAPREEMTKTFAEFFLDFVGREYTVLVSGSDYAKLKQQVPQNILNACQGVFGCAGAELFEQGKKVYQKSHTFDPELIKTVEAFIAQSSYDKRYGNHLEFRPGMLNISVVGRNATFAERKYYHLWDSRINERASFADKLNSEFSEYEASCGGEISIDIVPRGWNKSVVKGEVLERFPGSRLIFFGDRMGKGGNDQPLADVLNTPSGRHAAISVNNYKDTWMHLTHIKNAFNVEDAPIMGNTLWEEKTHETVQ